MKPLAGQLLFLLLLTLSSPAVGQSVQRPSFKATVHLTNGGWVSGVLDEVENGVIYFVPYKQIYSRRVQVQSASLALAEVERIVIKRTDSREAVRTGIAIGSLVGGYFGYQSSQKSKFKSPILAGISIALSAAAVGGVGAVVGSLVGGSTRRTIRPLDRDRPIESLERQLRPFTKVYLDDMQFNSQ